MINAKEFIGTLTSPDRLRILKGKKEVYVGYLGSMEQSEKDALANEEMITFRAIPEITHKQYAERGLIPPSEPDKLAEYSFSDLQMTLYYTIILKDENKERIEELQRIIMEHEECCKGCPDSGHHEACECCDVYGNMMDFQREMQGLEE